MVMSPSIAKQVLNQRATNSHGMTLYVMEKFFGDGGGIRKVDQELLWGTVHKQLYQLMREPFLSNAIAITVRAIEERTPNLISYSESIVDQTVWERSAELLPVAGATPSVEASLFPLMRNFVGDLASSVLMGHNFMENNPTILQDLWDWDNKFNLYLLGLPSWMPGLAKASQARHRFIDAVQEHQEALYAMLDGRDPGNRWSDLSDVSNIMVDRAREWRNAQASQRATAVGDCAVLWAMNVNANSVIFWMIWHVYSQPDLLAKIRKEIEQYVKLSPAPKSELPIREPDRLSIDMEALMRSCPLLKATYFETMRFEVGSISYKSIAGDFTVVESAEDASLAGR